MRRGDGSGILDAVAGLKQIAAAAAVVVGATTVPASAVPVQHSKGSGSSTPTGIDVSYPQCGSALPTTEAFGIAGVDDGLANTLNPCLGPSATYPSYSQSQLYWAVSTASGVTSQPKAELYVNTADPGNLYNGSPVADWPTSGSGTPYGTCTTTTVTTSTGTYTVGQDSPACAWQYGDARAAQDAAWLTQEADRIDAQAPPTAVSDQAATYPWWLDVETSNSWQSGTSGLQMNMADLQGMVAGLQAAGATLVGVYSTASQWGAVTGGTTTSAGGSLYQLPDWIPGARTLSGAESNCGSASFTSGSVVLTQWLARLDGDYSCRPWP